MKKYIINAISNGKKVYLKFDNEQQVFANEVLNTFDNDDNLIELKRKTYDESVLVNLSLVRYIKVK